MKIRLLEDEFSVMRYKTLPENLSIPYFTAVTEGEASLLCKSEDCPVGFEKRESGFGAMVIEGELDFSLVGIISRISTILADNDISVFVVSSFNTDYIFVRSEKLSLAAQLLEQSGYEII